MKIMKAGGLSFKLAALGRPRSVLTALYAPAGAAAGREWSLRVEVLRAAHLPRMDITGKADPYVVLSLGDQKERTKVRPPQGRLRASSGSARPAPGRRSISAGTHILRLPIVSD